jgi:hypothetical protein
MNGIDDISSLNDLVEQTTSSTQETYESYGASKLLVESSLFDNFRDFWTEAFFSTAGMRDASEQILERNIPHYNVFSRSNSSVFYTFTYNPDLALKGTKASQLL